LTPDGPGRGGGGGQRGFSSTGGSGWHPEPSPIPVAVPEEVRRTARHGDAAVLVERRAAAEGFEYKITTADGKVVRAYSTPSAIDAVTGIGRSTGKQKPKVTFHLAGFNEGEARSFLYNTELQMRNGSLTGFAKADGPSAYAAKVSEYRLPGVNLGEHSVTRVTEGPRRGLYELTVNFDVPPQVAGRPALRVRLQMLYRNAISSLTVSNVKNSIRAFFSKPVAADADMNAVIMGLADELRARHGGAKNVLTIWKEDTSGIVITELQLLPQSHGGNLRYNGKSE